MFLKDLIGVIYTTFKYYPEIMIRDTILSNYIIMVNVVFCLLPHYRFRSRTPSRLDSPLDQYIATVPHWDIINEFILAISAVSFRLINGVHTINIAIVPKVVRDR